MYTFVALSALAATALAQTAVLPGAVQASGFPGGVSPYLNSCKYKYTVCQSSNSLTCGNDLQACYATCSNQWDQCLAAGATVDKNACGLAYVQCVGDNPNDAQYVTITGVVPSYVTYCPGPTQFANNGQLYSIGSAGPVTVTNCPCTTVTTFQVTPTSGAGSNGSGSGSGSNGSGSGSGSGSSGSGSGSGSSSGSGSGSGSGSPGSLAGGSGNSTTGYNGAKYTGAASVFSASISLVAALSGALAYML